MTLAQKSPVKQQGQSPNGKAVNSPNNAVLKESYIPKRLLMGDMDMVDHGGGMLGCGSTTSDTSEGTSLRWVELIYNHTKMSCIIIFSSSARTVIATSVL